MTGIRPFAAKDIFRITTLSAAALLASACAGRTAPTPAEGPAPVAPPPAAPAPSAPAATGSGAFSGFDTSRYPGDAVMQAWRAGSPYQWVGYYLAAPCRRDSSWVGRRAPLAQMGWGLAVIYVGQQDWTQMPGRRAQPPVATDTTAPATPQPQPACASALLTPARGTTDADDAIARAAAEGFPNGSALYLDVEAVQTVSPALADYVRAWTERVLADGRYAPGIYCHRNNAQALHDALAPVFAARGGGSGAPRFWVTAPSGYTPGAGPQASGIPYASIWQTRVDVTESWGGYPLPIDANVADSPSPSGGR